MDGTQVALSWQDWLRHDLAQCRDMVHNALSGPFAEVTPIGGVSPILDVKCGVVGRAEGGDVADKILDVM